MTLTQDTVSNVLQIISDLRGESSTNSDSIRIRAISRAERDMAKRTLWQFFLLEDQTMQGTGNASYTIGSDLYPMRYKGLAEIFVGGTSEDKRISVIDYFTYKNRFNRNNADRIAYEWYDVVNDLWKVHINPAPATTDTITYSYFWEPPKRTGIGDPVICPDLNIVAKNALADIYHGEDELAKEQQQRQEAEQLISDLLGMKNMPAQDQTYAMVAGENMIKSQGIGTY